MSRGSRPRSRQQPQGTHLFDDTSVPGMQFYDPSAHAGGFGEHTGASIPVDDAVYDPSFQSYPSAPDHGQQQQQQQQLYQPQQQYHPQQQQQQQQQQYQQPGFAPTQLLGNPMVNDMAMQYGQQVFGQGSQYVQENLHKYVSASRIKYYFAVDNAYVGKKLLLLLFPYANRNWSLQYSCADAADPASQQAPVAPRFDANAPDLYIPAMAFLTYILLCGVALGLGNRFSPELLGVQTSTALVWLLIEILALLLTFYIFNLNSRLRYLDLVAYAGYKYVGMIVIVLSGILFSSLGFYLALLWCGAALAFFLVRTLNFQIQPADHSSSGQKRRLYLLLLIACVQPLFMWLLTSRVLA